MIKTSVVLTGILLSDSLICTQASFDPSNIKLAVAVTSEVLRAATRVFYSPATSCLHFRERSNRYGGTARRSQWSYAS